MTTEPNRAESGAVTSTEPSVAFAQTRKGNGPAIRESFVCEVQAIPQGIAQCVRWAYRLPLLPVLAVYRGVSTDRIIARAEPYSPS